MNERELQAALGVTVDGAFGPKSTAALLVAVKEGRVTVAPRVAAPVTTPISAPVTSRFKGIVMHWTAGGSRASTEDREHYHFLVQQDGSVVPGLFNPESNLTLLSGAYAAHTLNANTGRIGVSMCGMAGATERPFFAGVGLTQVQVEAFCELVASLCRKYGIPVTRQTVLSHAEVQPTLGIAQRGKWDVAWIPGMSAPGDPVAVGDMLRIKINSHL